LKLGDELSKAVHGRYIFIHVWKVVSTVKKATDSQQTIVVRRFFSRGAVQQWVFPGGCQKGFSRGQANNSDEISFFELKPKRQNIILQKS